MSSWGKWIVGVCKGLDSCLGTFFIPLLVFFLFFFFFLSLLWVFALCRVCARVVGEWEYKCYG
jgi:hypothetical protein